MHHTGRSRWGHPTAPVQRDPVHTNISCPGRVIPAREETGAGGDARPVRSDGEGSDATVATLVTRDDYFDAAIEILSTTDHGGLKQAPLCARLQVTTGSFYNYFGSWACFRTEFLRRWLERQTLELAASARRETSPARRMEILIDFACALPHRAESSIRGWAHNDPEVRAVQETVDEHRYAVVHEAVTALVGDDDAARDFARLALYTLAGYQQSLPMQDIETLRWSLQRVLDLLLTHHGRTCIA